MADEEDDDDVCDSWEDMADSGELERRMEERNKIQMEKESQIISATDAAAKVPVLIQDDLNRTQYKPQLRILKRPESEKDDSLGQSGKKNEAPTRKSLAERQAEYAQARARIMGSACEEEQQPCSAEEDESKTPNLLKNNREKTILPENVIRQPNGPDGTKGFNIKR